MSGRGKVIAVFIVLVLISWFFNTPSAEMTKDAQRYVELDKEFHEARRSVMRGDPDQNARAMIRDSDRAKALSEEMEAIKKKYPFSKVFKELVEEAKSKSE
jgi:hypothetical protein